MSEQIEQALSKQYEAGFYSEIESDTFENGLDESIIRRISAMKNEPEWMLEWRLKAYHSWLEMEEPDWAHVVYPKVEMSRNGCSNGA